MSPDSDDNLKSWAKLRSPLIPFDFIEYVSAFDFPYVL